MLKTIGLAVLAAAFALPVAAFAQGYGTPARTGCIITPSRFVTAFTTTPTIGEVYAISIGRGEEAVEAGTARIVGQSRSGSAGIVVARSDDRGARPYRRDDRALMLLGIPRVAFQAAPHVAPATASVAQ
jgi:hypothetical protein